MSALGSAIKATWQTFLHRRHSQATRFSKKCDIFPDVFKFSCFATLPLPLVQGIQPCLMLFNVFLFTLWLLCRSSRSSCSTGNSPLCLFWLVLLKFRQKFWYFSRKLSQFSLKWTPKRDTTAVSCHVMVWYGTLALRWLADSLFSWIWLAETNYPIFILIWTLVLLMLWKFQKLSN